MNNYKTDKTEICHEWQIMTCIDMYRKYDI